MDTYIRNNITDVNLLHMIVEATGIVALRETKQFEFDTIVDNSTKESTKQYQRDSKGEKIVDESASGKKNTVSTYHRLCEPVFFKLSNVTQELPSPNV